MFYAKWVHPDETTFDPVEHAVNEVGVFSFSLSQAENDFALLTLVARNPQEGLLNPGRRQWLWFSWQEDADTVTPLFFGRVVGVPEDITQVKISMLFRARPQGFRATKEALAATLKVAPYWDPIWIPRDQVDSPDVVLQARSAKWHIDRLSHAVSISDNIVGEDGTLTFDESDILAGSFSCRYNGSAASKVKVKAEVRWTQSATGTVDVTPNILAAFAAVGGNGGNPYMIASYTGGALVNSWPLPGDDIGGGWSVEDSSIVEGTGRWVSKADELQNVKEIWTNQQSFIDGEWVNTVRGTFLLWTMKPYLLLRYTAARGRTEIIEFEMSSDVQAMLADTNTGQDDADPIELSFASNDVSEPVDDGDTPIDDVRRASYINTDRGYESLEYLIARARASLLDGARVVTLGFTVPFHNIKNVTLRKNAAVEYDMIPGGTATGKIVGYNASGDGDGGQFILGLSVACTIGNGGSIAAITGSPDYVENDYVDEGYQTYSNQYELLAPGDVTYLNIDSTFSADDDGINFFDMQANDLLNYVIVTNGPQQQRSATLTFYTSLSAAIAAMDEQKTMVCLSPKRVTGGPFETLVDVTVNDLVVPKQIDLAAAGV